MGVPTDGQDVLRVFATRKKCASISRRAVLFSNVNEMTGMRVCNRHT